MADEELQQEDEVGIAVLLRFARRTYGDAIRAALAAVDCDDMPRNGIFVVGSIARTGAQLAQIIPQLGVSKQAAGQLIDTLVMRGYLERVPDLEDRRRMTITLTEHGELAAAEGRRAVEAVDAELIARVGQERWESTRATLIELIDIGEEQHAARHHH